MLRGKTLWVTFLGYEWEPCRQILVKTSWGEGGWLGLGSEYKLLTGVFVLMSLHLTDRDVTAHRVSSMAFCHCSSTWGKSWCEVSCRMWSQQFCEECSGTSFQNISLPIPSQPPSPAPSCPHIFNLSLVNQPSLSLRHKLLLFSFWFLLFLLLLLPSPSLSPPLHTLPFSLLLSPLLKPVSKVIIKESSRENIDSNTLETANANNRERMFATPFVTLSVLTKIKRNLSWMEHETEIKKVWWR